MRRTILIACLSALWPVSAAPAETVTCKDTRDVWVSACEGETNFNMGAANKIKLKAYQEFGILDFDVSALAGKKITEAWLYLKPVGERVVGTLANSNSDLRWLTVSTVGHDWVEGKSKTYAKDPAGNGATWNESSYQKDNWGWPGATLADVAFGNGNTLRFDGAAEAEGEWLKLRLDPCLVQAMVAKATYGLLLQDGNGCVTHVNAFITSREAELPPYLKVTFEGEVKTRPVAPNDLKVEPAPNWATPALCALQVSLKAPVGTFAFRVKVNGSEVGRWQVPFPDNAGTRQMFPIIDLPTEQDVTVEVVAVDAAGNESPAATAKGKTGPRLAVPALPACDFVPKEGEPKALGDAKVWAFPEVTKVDPKTGEVLLEEGNKDFRKKNPVWDGSTGTVRLAAARGEIVSFQVAVEGKITGGKVAVSSLKGPAEVPASAVRLWRNWYVGNQSEYALPLKGDETFDCPSADNKIAGQTVQAITVDIAVPKDARPGDYVGTVTVSAGDKSVELPLKVKVHSAVIPDEVFFNPELNCYGGPGYANSPKFKNSFRVAHYNRCTINRVPYSQNTPGANGDWSPKIDAAGKIVDWKTFDDNLGPLLDGSLFKDNPRADVPVPTLYLPLHLGWPVDFRKHYRPGEGLGHSGSPSYFNNDFSVKLRHDLACKPPAEAFDQEWKDIFAAATKEFVRHCTEKGYTRTLLEFYNNQKWSYGFSAWNLDEPEVTLDWLMLGFLGKVFDDAVADPAVFAPGWPDELFAKGLSGMKRDRATFVYRTDISRPEVQGSLHDGTVSIVYANVGQFASPRLMRGHKVRGPMLLYCYGACNAMNRSNWESAAWCLKSYAHHCDGVLPWESLDGRLTQGGNNGLIIDGGKGYPEAVASFRVHALRRGAQDCELLRLLQLEKGWSREHVGLLVSQKVPLTSAFKQAFADEAAAAKFGNLTSQGFAELKEGILKLLE